MYYIGYYTQNFSGRPIMLLKKDAVGLGIENEFTEDPTLAYKYETLLVAFMVKDSIKYGDKTLQVFDDKHFCPQVLE